MEIGGYLLSDFSCGRPIFSRKITPGFFQAKFIWLGRGGVRVSVSSIVSGIFRNIPSHNTGTTRGPHQFPPFLPFTLDKN